MLSIQQLSASNINDGTSLIYEFQIDHFEKFGDYYQIIPNAKIKIKELLADLFNKKTGQINKRDFNMFIAYSNNTPAGYIFLRIDKNIPIYTTKKYGYISGLYVNPKFRKKGVASSLLLTAEKWFKQKKVLQIELKANVGNDAGISFWKKNGFHNQQILMVKNS